MWGGEETGAMEEYYYSESSTYTEPKLIDFFKCETPLRKNHGELSGEQTHAYIAGKQKLGSEGNGGSQELSAIADGGRSLKLEPPSGNFADFLGGNGDDPKVQQVAVSRSSSDDAGKHSMVPKSIQEAVTGDQWSLIMARRGLPNLILNLLSPSPTGTQASGTSPPKTPTFDMELNSRTRSTQPNVTSIPDHEGESSTFSADSDRRLTGNFLPDVVDRNPKLKGQSNSNVGSRVRRWSPKNGQKRLRIRTPHDDDEAAMVEGSRVELSRTQKDEEVEAVVQAAASLLSLSSNEDDWKQTVLRRSVSSSPAVVREGSMTGTRNGNGNGHETRKGFPSSSSLAVVGEGSERESGESGSSVLSRPSNKRRYRLMVDLLAESPRVR